jgi:anthranilate phosphoribosyltransferase
MQDITAFTLVRVKAGFEHSVAEKLRKVREIKEVYIVYGEWDILVKIVAKTIKELKDVITKNIRSLEGVEDTSTLVVTD